MKTIRVKFDNPRIVNGDYVVDAMFQAKEENTRVFGMNVRFFYDTSVLKPATHENVKLQNYVEPYAHHQPYPPIFGNSKAGKVLFGLPSTVAYVNAAMFGEDRLTAPYLPTDSWLKLFEVSFKINGNPTGEFAPSLIWDLEKDTSRGSFLPGSEGVVITAHNEQGNTDSELALEEVEQFNWEYSGSGNMPYGHPNTNNAITI